ncbi:MAG: hypothetical protein Q4P20_01785 [Eubacteriales bacterium]|nr:hypothetical protein [Eubacteriales bacterium]
MRIEKFYYSESIAACEARKKEMWEKLRSEINMPQGMSEEEEKEWEWKAVKDMVSKIMPSTEVYTMLDPRKYDLFFVLAQVSVRLAQALTANLLVYTEDMTGWIIFVGTSIYCEDRDKDIFSRLVSAANGMHISASVDTGKGSPTDVDNAVQATFWFDLCTAMTETSL